MHPRHFAPFALALGLLSCGGSDSLGPALPAATFSVSTVDQRLIPIVVSADTACQTINAGGWLTLQSGNRYAMVIDRIGVLCAGVFTTGTFTVQQGRYTVRGDSVHFRANPPDGPDFAALYDPGAFTHGQGGRLPNLTFSFVGHEYFLISDGLIGVRSGSTALP